MTILKSLTIAAALVVGLSTLAEAAPHHARSIHSMAYGRAANAPVLPYGFPEGVYGSAVGGPSGLDANTRTAEAFQDYWRNSY